MSQSINEEYIHQYFESLSTGNLESLDTYVSEDFVDHEKLLGIPSTRAGLKQKYSLLRTGFPDLHFVVEDIMCIAEQVAVRATVRGTHTTEFMGRSATGRSFEVTSIGIFLFADGRIIEHWGVFDQMGMLAQLAAFPAS
ncbi:MAG TPA: ester cyclase [Ktedonobacteraceae bacterium]|jgi:steroid delta-isomerase-like uncharacterized protein|nr:ester cyclase [Ktedonobacteraceae bacterium]